VSPVKYAGGKSSLRAYIAVRLQIHYIPSSWRSKHTFNVLLHYLVKCLCSKIAMFWY